VAVVVVRAVDTTDEERVAEGALETVGASSFWGCSSSSDRKCLILLAAASLSLLRSSCVAECVTERGAGCVGDKVVSISQ